MLTRRRFLITASAAGGAAAAPPRPAQHSLLTPFPGKLPLDLWGWESTPFYQRTGGKVATPEYLKRRAVEESFRCGANLLEIYRGGYPLERRAGWTAESTAGFHRFVHQLDMLVHWFPHRLETVSRFEPAPIQHFDPHTSDPTSTFDGAAAALRALGASQFDVLRFPPEDLLDGMGIEQWPVVQAMVFHLCFLSYQPGAYFYTDNKQFDETLPNQIDASASNGTGSDDQTTGYYQLHERIRKKGGMEFWGSQAECRTVIPENRFGGVGFPDWVLKQVNDQFRARLRRRGQMLSPSAIWWINEAEDVCPEENRRYVYGISQDPVRCAVTARFTAVGKGGIERGGKRLPERYPYPSEYAFIQNNYLRLVAPHDRDGAILIHDPERLAHYDGNSAAVVLADPFGECLPGAAAVAFEHPEPAGYRAVLRATAGAGTRTIEMTSDTPYLRMRWHQPCASVRFGFQGFDQLTNHPSGRLRLRASRGGMPELVLIPSALRRFTWQAGKLELVPEGPLELVLVVPKGLYDSESRLDELQRFLKSPEEEAGAVVRNPFRIPVVKVVRVRQARGRPYQVHEFGRWVHRGAQPSLLEPGTDYLKCYLPPGGSARIQSYGFLEGAARPGWGCQYSLTLRKLKRTGGRCQAEAEVHDITSFLFAPRVRFANPIGEARVRGARWSYLDGANLFLPNRRGVYKLSVKEGQAAGPTLARTFARIDECESRGRELRLVASLPEWIDSVPPEYRFASLVRHPGLVLTSVNNGELLRCSRHASVLRLGTGEVRLRFGAGEGPPRSIDLEEEATTWLNRLSAEMVLPYLEGFETETVPMRRLDDCAGLVVWNHFFSDVYPMRRAVNLLRYAERGGRLLLLTNAVLLLSSGVGRTVQVGHHLNQVVAAMGVEAADSRHPLFEGLTGGPRFPLYDIGGSDLFKRALPEELFVKASPLGKLFVRFHSQPVEHPFYEPSPVLWEAALGKGKVIALSLGLRFTNGSPGRWRPSANLRRLIQNAAGLLTEGGARRQACVLW